MVSRRGLGRGLDALMSSTTREAEAASEIAIDAIRPSRLQPRQDFDEGSLEALAQSIRSSGVIQPVVVRRAGAGYELIAGERRWRAARLAGLERIPVLVREATDAGSLELALVENLLREDLNPIEEGLAYQRLIAEFGWAQDQLAQRVGRDRSSVANSLRLLKLPQPIQDDLRAGRLTMGHARAVLGLTTEAEQLKLRDEILAHTWSVRATEETVQRRRATVPVRRRRSVELAALEETLQRTLLTRVRIVGNDRRGKIEITYASAAELERLAGVLSAQA